MIAFHGDPAIKRKYVARVVAHRKADNLIRGQGWDNGKGCAVGCTLEAYDHARYPVELGVPMELARLEDWMFEAMPEKDAMAWPARFLRAIPVGADLSMVWPRFALWLLAHELKNWASTTGPVADLYRRWITGDKPSDDEWCIARASAASYAAAARAAAAYAAAYADARAAASYAADAAYARAASALRQAEHLLKLLRGAR